MKTHNGSPVSAQSPKPRKHRNREVSSRFLPSPPSSTTTSTEYAFPLSPGESHSHSPLRCKTGSSPADSRSRHSKNTEDHSFTRPQLWPSSVKRNSGTLADHITEDRIREVREQLEFETKIDEKKKPTETSSIVSQNKQKSFREFSSKENDRPIIGGSMRFLGKLGSAAQSSSSSSSVKKPSSILPGRLSVDENALYKKSLSSRRNSCSFNNSLDSESDYSDACSPAAAGTTLSSRKMGMEVPSKYMSDVVSRRGRRGTSDSNIMDLNSDSSALKKLALKTTIKRANSLTGYKSSKSQWALSPGRSESPTMCAESMDKPMSFSSVKHPTSPTKVKGVERFLSMGFDLFKSKKSLFNSSSPSSPMGLGNSEAVHQLRMLDNRLIQWRYANARAQAVNENICYQAESNLIYAWDGLTKLQHSALKRKIQFGREKLEMKLNFILYSQMKLLEAWGGMERQHLSAITVTRESLHSVVCRVPLLEGAKVDIPSASIALRHASDLTASIKSILTSFSPSEVDKTAAMLSELAKVVAQEKQLLEEFYDLFQTISALELQERIMKCNLIQLEDWQRKNQQQQLLPEITS